jgi:hypothetical protein
VPHITLNREQAVVLVSVLEYVTLGHEQSPLHAVLRDLITLFHVALHDRTASHIHLALTQDEAITLAGLAAAHLTE